MPGWVDCCYFGVCHLFTICMKTITIEVSEKELEDLKKQLELEKEKPKRWRAGIGETYYLVSGDGYIGRYYESGDEDDDWHYSQRNYFQTEEEAKKYKKYLECVAKIKDSSDFLPDWRNASQKKYCIGYDHDLGKLDFSSWYDTQTNAIVNYETKLQVQQAMIDLKDEYEYVFAYERGKA